MIKYDSDVTLKKEENKISSFGEQLKNGIWPQSLPLWMAAFYLALFIIRPWEQLFPWMGEYRFERVYALLMIATVFLSTKTNFKMTFQTVAVIGFVISVGISSLFAMDTSLAWDVYYEYITLLIFYFIMIFVIRNPYELSFMIICYVLTMFVYLGKSQWEFFVHGQHRYDMGVIRMVGIEHTLGGPNNLAMSIAASLPFAILIWTHRKVITRKWPKFFHQTFPWFIIGYFCIAVTSIILTNSRSGMLGGILYILLLIIKGNKLLRTLKYAALASVFLALVWHFMPLENKDRLRTIWDPQAGPECAQWSADGRVDGFDAGMRIFSKNFLFGIGVGNFIPYRVKYDDGLPFNPHNLPGQLLAETGIFGGLMFSLMILVTYINCTRIISVTRNSSNSTHKYLSDIATACKHGLIILLFLGLAGHNVLRFNWLWFAAFSSLALDYAVQIPIEKENNA